MPHRRQRARLSPHGDIARANGGSGDGDDDNCSGEAELETARQALEVRVVERRTGHGRSLPCAVCLRMWLTANEV